MTPQEMKIECEIAATKVEKFTVALSAANAALWADPRSAIKRRLQKQAYSDLSQAQFELERALDRVNPRTDG